MPLQPQPTITSLLNSLHSHLQTQTQLLPTLHAQLGLPPTALADELSSLQKALTRCVEDQISSRRKQVHELEERCENLESECYSYSVALGPSAKGLEITAMELRREPILPRRYDQLAELQEKLRQVSKLLVARLTLADHGAVISHQAGAVDRSHHPSCLYVTHCWRRLFPQRCH
jgi:protein regulator of cytokinesis 1